MTPTNPAAYLGLYAAFTGKLPPINLYNIGPCTSQPATERSASVVKFHDRTNTLKIMKEIYGSRQ